MNFLYSCYDDDRHHHSFLFNFAATSYLCLDNDSIVFQSKAGLLLNLNFYPCWVLIENPRLIMNPGSPPSFTFIYIYIYIYTHTQLIPVLHFANDRTQHSIHTFTKMKSKRLLKHFISVNGYTDEKEKKSLFKLNTFDITMSTYIS